MRSPRSLGEDGVLARVSEVGAAVGHVLAGFFIVLFSTYFFLADGDRIWAWLVRLAPRAARERVDSSGRVAWISLTQFVRATVIVAAVDAVVIAIGAAILGVPFALAIGVLVFLGAFVPIIGATIAGAVAVLVALVDQGPITALIMLGVVIGVQQLEGHVLQPFLHGPLGVGAPARRDHRDRRRACSPPASPVRSSRCRWRPPSTRSSSTWPATPTSAPRPGRGARRGLRGTRRDRDVPTDPSLDARDPDDGVVGGLTWQPSRSPSPTSRRPAS